MYLYKNLELFGLQHAIVLPVYTVAIYIMIEFGVYGNS